ncbi:phospholipase D-like domain-containing protein [Fervidobacterium thailandense]|uniref:phospholipase D n=1 Tax=Fervidobacterium thailandense TaxID=1008305 RepID=A0A1E3G4J9_9BACT|nr:phospholipase D-like domain-containing protein [Fervidobacterium thailandense]ODN31159.1 phospholipase [Fervidobacterium thailandense]
MKATNVTRVLIILSLIPTTLLLVITASNVYERAPKAYFTLDGSLEDAVLDFIRSSREFIYISALHVDHPAVLDTLKELRARGVDVRVVTEKPVLGVPSKIDAEKGLHHVKFAVNERGVLFGSANFSVSGLRNSLNDVLSFDERYSERFKTFFLNLWNHGKITEIPGFTVSPLDDVEGYVLRVLQSARRRVWICMYAFTDQEVMATLKLKESQGLDVRVITDRWFKRSPIYKYGFGHLKIISSKLLHHKFILADDTLLTGSTNYTETGFHRNVEMIYTSKNPRLVGEYERIFKLLWSGH